MTGNRTILTKLKSIGSGEITGRKFLMIFVSFFVVIIGVNLTLAYWAVATFPGLETSSAYIRNQSFDRDKESQLALGWHVVASVQGTQLRVAIRDRDDRPVSVRDLTGIFGRPTTVRDDQVPEFTFTGADYVAPIKAGPGNWNFRMRAIATDGTPFEQRVIVLVDG